MDKKVIIAIAAVAILVIGGCAVAAVLMNDNGSSEPLKVDNVRSDVKADDYLRYGVTGTTKISGDKAGTTSDDFVGMLFNPSVTTGKLVSQGEIKYKDKTIEYKCYEIYGSYYYIGLQDVVYRYSLPSGAEYTLIDTNLDLSKDAASQTVSKGSYFTYSMKQVQGEEPNRTYVEGTVNYSYTAYDVVAKSGTVHYVNDMKMTGYMIKTVASVSADGTKVTLTDGSTISKTDFLSYVNKDCMIQNLNNEGYTVTEGEKTKKTLDTEFGKRNVTVEEVKCFKTSSDNQIYTITYGENGAIYTMRVVGTEGNMSADSTPSLPLMKTD